MKTRLTKRIGIFIFSTQLIWITPAVSQSTSTKYTSVTFDNTVLGPLLERAQKALSPKELLIILVTPSPDTTLTTVYISSVTSITELEKNVPTIVGQYKRNPILVYLRNTPMGIRPSHWGEIHRALKHVLRPQMVEYDPDVYEVILKGDTLLHQRTSMAIHLPGWHY